LLDSSNVCRLIVDILCAVLRIVFPFARQSARDELLKLKENKMNVPQQQKKFSVSGTVLQAATMQGFRR